MNRKNQSVAAPPDFEKSLQELEKLIAQLERGDLPLAESLALFEQGVALTRSCHASLAGAQQRVEILLKEGAGERLRPFDADSESGVD
ncbi:MAG: exodeoxyribonuclease VII small subunit [Steroidobacteraceae bacterium]